MKRQNSKASKLQRECEMKARREKWKDYGLRAAIQAKGLTSAARRKLLRPGIAEGSYPDAKTDIHPLVWQNVGRLVILESRAIPGINRVSLN